MHGDLERGDINVWKVPWELSTEMTGMLIAGPSIILTGVLVAGRLAGLTGAINGLWIIIVESQG